MSRSYIYMLVACAAVALLSLPGCVTANKGDPVTSRQALAKTPLCGTPDVPFGPIQHETGKMKDDLSLQLSDGRKVTVQLPSLETCINSPVVLTGLRTQDPPAPGTMDLSAKGTGVEVFVVYWVSTEEKGDACVKINSDCRRITRPLPLSLDPESSSNLRAQFTPDPSSSYYVFVVHEVGNPFKCVRTPVISAAAWSLGSGMRQCRSPTTPLAFGWDVHGAQPQICKPLLHREVPSQRDFYLRLPFAGAGGLTSDAPLLADNRVAPGSKLRASWGINRFVISYPEWLQPYHAEYVTNTTLYGRLASRGAMVNLDFEFTYDPGQRGYVAQFDLRDSGAYALQVFVGWYHGETEAFHDPKPILVGGHMNHEYNVCNLARAAIDGLAYSVTLDGASPPAGIQAFGDSKCLTADQPGRWLWYNKDCTPPYCTGDRKKTVNYMDWDGSQGREWLWVPYTCYYHLYSRDDVYRCAVAKDITWIHAMGDSQEREFVAVMKMMNETTQEEATKFAQASWIMDQSPNHLRVSWQFYEESLLWVDARTHPRKFATDKKYLDHYNIRPSPDSGAPMAVHKTSGHPYNLPEKEDTRPDVTLISHAAAYAAWKQTRANHRQWMDEFLAYLDNGRVLGHPDAVPGRPGLSKPMRMLWYSPSFVFSQAHGGTEWVTTKRVLEFDRYARKMMHDRADVSILDATSITQSMWEASYDGLHYLRGANDFWHGMVSHMVAHANLNAVFQECGLQTS